jgi:hypothetical protein
MDSVPVVPPAPPSNTSMFASVSSGRPTVSRVAVKVTVRVTVTRRVLLGISRPWFCA